MPVNSLRDTEKIGRNRNVVGQKNASNITITYFWA